MEIYCQYNELIETHKLAPHPKNANKHPEAQIERLAKILQYQGWRSPIVVSTRSNYITKGHGRLMAAQHNKWEKVPVQFQDYEDEDQELADIHADNAIASWAELDLGIINSQLGEFDPTFDLDLLGLKDFVLEPADLEEPEENGEPKDREFQTLNCPNCGILIEKS